MTDAYSPTDHEDFDKEVADTRETVRMWLGNSYPVYERGMVLADRCPLALGLFVVASLYGVREDDFTPLQYATMHGEVHRDLRAKRLLNGLLEHVHTDGDPEALVLSGPQVDNNTLSARQHTADHCTRHNVIRIDWHKLAEDMRGEGCDWQQYTSDHDGRGCSGCLNGTCMVGYEDADDTISASEPDREAIEREAAYRLGLAEG